MADLDPSLFADLVGFLSPHLWTEESRHTVLTPLLSQWPGWDDLRWEGSGKTFTTELVRQMPNALLTSVLRSLQVGAEQQHVVAGLCARIEAADALRWGGPLPRVRVTAKPAAAGDGSMMFRAGLSLDRIRAGWRELPPGRPLALVTDFAPDAGQCLAALAEEHEPSCWIAGESLLDPAPPGSDGVATLADLPPGLLLVDFSAVRPDRPPDVVAAGQGLQSLLLWAESRGHRVALGLPRYLVPHLGLDPLRWQSGLVYWPAELFSHRYAERAERCESLLKGRLPMRDVLFPLLSANSAALPRAAAALLSEAPRRRSPTESDEIAALLRLARGLAAAGFLEIAYRLEVHCRTRPGRSGRVPLSADLWPEPRDTAPADVVGFAADTSEVPALAARAVLTGGTGTGKTSALVDVEHRWSLPRMGDATVRAAAYLPLHVPLAADDARGLPEQIDAHLCQEESWWLDHGDERSELTCHALIGRLGGLAAMRTLFSSPILLLLDDADRAAAAAPDRFVGDLAALRRADPDMGLLVTSWDGRLAGILGLDEVRLRALNEQQVRQFLEHRGGDPSLLDLLATHDRPLAPQVVNPRVLGLLCDLELEFDDVGDTTLAGLVEMFVAHQARLRSASDGGRVRLSRPRRGRSPAPTDDRVQAWLAEVALEFVATGTYRRVARSPEEAALTADAQVLRLLHHYPDRSVIEFGSETIKNYFAARGLAARIDAADVATVMQPFLARQPAGRNALVWRDVCRMLVPLLRVRDAGRLVDLIAHHIDVRFAHECALELPAGSGEAGATAAAILLDRIADPQQELPSRVRDARALGRHDPRIRVAGPLDGTIEIPPSQRSEAFRIGRYPVTTMEYAAFVAADGYRNRDWWTPAGWDWVQRHRVAMPRYWRNRLVGGPNHPVVGVSFFEATAYCAWLTGWPRHRGFVFELPSAVEWDRAAHGDEHFFEMLLSIAGGAKPRHPARRPPTRSAGDRAWDRLDLTGADPVAREQLRQARELAAAIDEYLKPHQEERGFHQLAPVGVFAPNRRGIHDMFGSLWQWCNTSMSAASATEREFGDAPAASASDGGPPVVVKGGTTAADNSVWLLAGGWFDPAVQFPRLGFRVKCRAERASRR